MIAFGVLPVLVMALGGHSFGKSALYDSEKGHLGFALRSRAIWLQEWLHFTRNEFHHTAQEHSPAGGGGGADEGMADGFEHALRFLARGHARYASLAAYDAQWNLLADIPGNALAPEPPPLPADLHRIFDDGRDFGISSEIAFDGDHVIATLAQRVRRPDGAVAAYIVGGLDLTHSLRRILGDASDFGETGRLALLDAKGTYLVAPSDRPGLAGQSGGVPARMLGEPFGEIHPYRDGRGIRVLGVATPLGKTGWFLVAHVDESEALHWVNLGALVGLGTGTFTVVAIFLLAFRMSRRLTRELRELAAVARAISAGDLGRRAPDFADAEARELAEAFNHMLDRIEVGQRALGRSASLAAVGELSAGIVHEMRNPLASVKLNLQGLLEMLRGDPSAQECAGLALDQANRLEHMLSDLLHFGRPLELRRRPVRLQEVIDEVLPLVQEEARRKGVSLRVQDGLGGADLWLDAELLIRALTNLLTNAIQWSPPGGTVRLVAAPLPDAPEWFAIAVQDEGPGVPPERRERLFQPFFTTRPEGTGLGLANVRKIVEHHGGTVFLDGASGTGAKFTVHLPFRGEAP
jgi:signal transduction histidine kinase